MFDLLSLDARTIVILVTGVLLNGPAFYVIATFFWSSLDGFGESVRFYFTPDLWSAIRGECIDDIWNELKLMWFVAICASILFAECGLYQAYLTKYG